MNKIHFHYIHSYVLEIIQLMSFIIQPIENLIKKYYDGESWGGALGTLLYASLLL